MLRRFLISLRRRWKEKGWSEERLRRLLKFLDGLIELPEELDRKLFEKLSKEVEEVNRYVPPLFREEYERGVQEGIRQGIKEGLLRSLEVMLRMKFGIEGLKLLPELKKLPVEKLEVIVKAMPELENLNQLKELKGINGVVEGFVLSRARSKKLSKKL